MSSYQTATENLATPNGQIFIKTYTPEAEPRALLVIIHGYCEHTDRYTFMADYFAQKNFLVTTFDLPGHGQSYGARAHIGNYTQYIKIINEVINRQNKRPELPLFVFGHSMGGLLTTLYLENETPANLRAAAISSPYLASNLGLSAFATAGAKFLGLIMPRFKVNSVFTGKDVCQNPEIITAYDNDPQITHYSTAGWFRASCKAQELAAARIKEIKVPLYCLAAGQDKLAKSSVTEALLGQVETEHEFHLLADSYHEILNETAYREWGLGQISDWFEKHLS